MTEPFFSRLLIFFFVVLSLGCASMGQLSQSIGGPVLDAMGLSPAMKAFEAGDGLMKAIKEPNAEEEYYLGRAVSAEIVGRYPLEKGKAVRSYISEVGGTLVMHSDRPEIFGGYHFGVLSTPQRSAYSAPGGFVFVSRGLLNVLSDEDTLAAILAHELGHVIAQHGVKSIQTSSLKNVVQDLGGEVVGSLDCAQITQASNALFGEAVNEVAGTLLERGYNRDQEREADEIGTQLLSRAGYDARALIDALKILQSVENDGGGWFSTHPALSDRIEELEDELENQADESSARTLRAARFAKIIK